MRLEVSCDNRPGMAREILDVLSSVKINVLSGEFASERYIYLHTPDMNFNQLQSILPKIRRIDGVDDVHPIPLMPREKRQVEQQTLLDSLPDVVLSVDLEGRVLAGNQAAAELLQLQREKLPGYGLESVIGNRSLVDLIHDTDGLTAGIPVLVAGRHLQLEMKPIRVPVGKVGYSLTGAVLILKRPATVVVEDAYCPVSVDQFFSQQPDMVALLRRARRMARTDRALLIEGETGSGKSLLARLCHQSGSAAKGPFVTLDCSALGDQQLEQALFGRQDLTTELERAGLLERAVGGTLLLEQVQEMSPLLQSRLLQFVDSGFFRRVGGQRDLFVPVRVMATAQIDLRLACDQGVFRRDLYHRLSELSLRIPPLRQRNDELQALMIHLLERQCRRLGREIPDVSPQLFAYLQAYDWPGNVRELDNQLANALAGMDDAEVLAARHFSLPTARPIIDSGTLDCQGTLDECLGAFEARLLSQLYPQYPSSRLLAKRLGLSHTAVAKKLRAYGIAGRAAKKLPVD